MSKSRNSSKPASRANSKPSSIMSQDGDAPALATSEDPAAAQCPFSLVVNGDMIVNSAATSTESLHPKPLEREGTWGRFQRMFTNPHKEPRGTPIDRSKGTVTPSPAATPVTGKSPVGSPGKSAAERVPISAYENGSGNANSNGVSNTNDSSTTITTTTTITTSSSGTPAITNTPATNGLQHTAPEKIGIEKHPTSTSIASNASSIHKLSRSSTMKDMPRFVPGTASTSGCHEHHLRSSRRQEKLSNKFKSLLGKKAEAEAADPDDLSLVSDWVGAALKREQEEAAVDKKGGPNDTKSLVEKYGKCQEVVGRGAFGIVRISHKKQEHGERLFAVKEFRRRPEETEKRYSKRLLAEYNIGISLLHPNICRTLDLVRDDKGDLCEVMEYCAGGDLYTLVLSAGKLEAQEADCFFKQMMRGVQYLHEMGVAHRDLKPENLLLTTRGALKITDFGNGECFRYAWETEPHMVSGVCGSAPYIAPEEYTDKEFDGRAVDVWACGVIYMAMRTGRHLWNVAKKEEDEFYKSYLEGRKCEDGYSPIESLHRARCRNVIYSVLDPSSSRRLTAAQVLKSEWLREIKLCRAGEEGL